MIVTGMVEATSDKFGKFGVLVNGKWYNTKPEWCPVQPSKGDNISFDDGGKNYLKNIKILGKGTGVLPTVHGGAAPNKNLGVELGHASKIAADMALCKFEGAEIGSDEWYKFWIYHTDRVYKAMAGLRSMKEKGESAPPVSALDELRAHSDRIIDKAAITAVGYDLTSVVNTVRESEDVF